MNWWQMVVSGVLIFIGHARSMQQIGPDTEVYETEIHFQGIKGHTTITTSNMEEMKDEVIRIVEETNRRVLDYERMLRR